APLPRPAPMRRWLPPFRTSGSWAPPARYSAAWKNTSSPPRSGRRRTRNTNASCPPLSIATPYGRATPCTITWSASWRACEKISAAAACASCRHPARKAPRQQHPKVKTMQLTRTLTALLATAGIALAAPAQALDIKLGHVLAPSHSWHKAAEGFAADVKEKTDGRVNFVLYPSGQLGNEKTMIEGLQIGSQGAAIIGSGSLQPVEPKFGIVELPYTWNDTRQGYAAYDGELGEALAKLAAAKNLVILSWWENGFRHLTNN